VYREKEKRRSQAIPESEAYMRGRGKDFSAEKKAAGRIQLRASSDAAKLSTEER